MYSYVLHVVLTGGLESSFLLKYHFWLGEWRVVETSRNDTPSTGL